MMIFEMYSAPVIPTFRSSQALSFLETVVAIAMVGILTWIVVASQSAATHWNPFLS